MGETSLTVGQDGPAGLHSWLAALSIGSPQQAGDLTLVPLLHAREPREPDTLVDEAIDQGQLEIVEKGGGVVQQVLAHNHGDADVLVLEGDTLIGCNQNRMVAWSVLVGAGTIVPVSVGCMERGRWSQGGRAFMAGEMAVDPHIRRRSKRETNVMVGMAHGPQLNQGRAWADVDGKLREWQVSSGTGDYHAGLLARLRETNAGLRHLQPLATQVGAIALFQNRLLGLEAVAHPKTWSVLAQRLLPSYAVGARSARRDPEFAMVLPRSPDEWLGLVASAETVARRARGKGYDVVIRDQGITGTCLWHEGRARHLAVFPS